MQAKFLMPLTALTLLVSCGPSEEERCAEKLAKLDDLRAEATANVVRQRAECQAVGIETHGDSTVIANCMETLRFVSENALRTHADVDKRMTAPDMTKCVAQRFAVPGTGPGGQPPRQGY